jgi:hypothetical protein
LDSLEGRAESLGADKLVELAEDDLEQSVEDLGCVIVLEIGAEHVLLLLTLLNNMPCPISIFN